MVLLLPLLVTEITANLVLQTMNNVKTSAVDERADKVFGTSALALRSAAFSTTRRHEKCMNFYVGD